MAMTTVARRYENSNGSAHGHGDPVSSIFMLTYFVNIGDSICKICCMLNVDIGLQHKIPSSSFLFTFSGGSILLNPDASKLKFASPIYLCKAIFHILTSILIFLTHRRGI